MFKKLLGLLVLSLIFVGCGVTPVEDTEKPTLSITSPANNATVTTATVTVTGTAKDNIAVTKLSYTLNGGASVDVTSKLSSGNFNFDVALGSAGSKTIKVTATDAAGKSVDATRTITLQATSTINLTGKWELTVTDTTQDPDLPLTIILELQQTGTTITGKNKNFANAEIGNVTGTIQSSGALTLRVGFENESGGHWNVTAIADDSDTFSGDFQGWADDAETSALGNGPAEGVKAP